MNEQTLARTLLLGLVSGLAAWAAIKVAARLEDPYSEPRLTLSQWLSDLRGGDTA